MHTHTHTHPAEVAWHSITQATSYYLLLATAISEVIIMELGRVNPWRQRAYYAGVAASALYRHRGRFQAVAQEAARRARQWYNQGRRASARAARVNAARGLVARAPFKGIATKYVRSKTYWRRGRKKRFHKKKLRLIKNRGYRKTVFTGAKVGRNFKNFTLSNKALTNLLTPMAHEHVETSLNNIIGGENTQFVRQLYHCTVNEVQNMYDKSQDIQNIATITPISKTTQKNQWLKLCRYVARYRFQNAGNTTITLKLIEADFRDFSNFEITDKWAEDLQAQFPLRDAETFPNGEVVQQSQVGLVPFGKYDRLTNKHFKLRKKSVVVLEPGQTMNYSVLVRGRGINMSDINAQLSEGGAYPTYGPWTRVLVMISHGQLVQDTGSGGGGGTGYGSYQLESVVTAEKYYRANLQQQVYSYYKDSDEDYATFAGTTRSHINPTNEHVVTYADA